MRLLGNRILGRVIDDEPTESGLIINDYRLKKYKAKVLAVGPKTKYVKVGDAIQYDHNECENYDINGDKCVFIKENIGFIAKL